MAKKYRALEYETLASRLSYDAETGKVTFSNPRSKRYGKELGYLFTGTTGKTYLMASLAEGKVYIHRVAWILHSRAAIPEGMEVDHIDGDGTNNRICNLRLVKPADNGRNLRRKSNNTSGYNGITYRENRNRYNVSAGLNGKQVYLGSFRTLKEAVAARAEFDAQGHYHKNHGTERPL